MIKIIKRNGSVEDFQKDKIKVAILEAMNDLGPEYIHEDVAQRISREISKELEASNPSNSSQIPIHQIEDRVEEKLMASHHKAVARQYIVYRAQKSKIRMEKQALDLIADDNDELRMENSNKNTLLVPTQRDYLAGIMCKDISRSYFTQDALLAHDKGLIHINDLDFSPTLPMANCCLVNLDDMLQNGTKLSDMDIVKPKSFATACAIAAQVVLAVSSSQYGGTTISLSHLSPFVRVSHDKYVRQYRDLGLSGDMLHKVVQSSLKKEIKDGLQTLIYNILTFANSNGQSPFVSIFLWINEKKGFEKETAMLIEELIQQRKDGFKDKNGRSMTIAFPKLLYVLDENNTYEGSEYYYLTRLSAECTAKRLVPDYISAKVMKKLKEDNCYPCMGCVDGKEMITYKIQDDMYEETFEQMWERLSSLFKIRTQLNGKDYFMDLKFVYIHDKMNGFVNVQRIIRNHSTDWILVKMTHGRSLLCTTDHPFVTERGRVLAKNLILNDKVPMAKTQYDKELEEDEDFCHIKELIPLKMDQYSYDVTTTSDHFDVSGIYSHNCRSFLQPYVDENGEPKYYGRFNQGVVTINLPYIAMTSQKDIGRFWEVMEEVSQYCYDVLMARHNRLKGVKSDVAPILWQNGALARLKPGETIDKLLYNDYSSISLGYAGVYECVKYLTGQSHTDKEGRELAVKILEFLNHKCDEWKEKTNIGFSIYGTPIESTTYKFAQALQRDFGIVPDVSDHDYITNSYHVNVREPIDAFNKLKFEAEFQELSKGGMISYIEVPSMFDNIDALISVIQFIYENTMYAEINTKSDFCDECGFDGEMNLLKDKNGKLVWRCPHCGNEDMRTLHIIRRTCGYLGTNFWNQGRTQEIGDRVLHL